MKTETQKQDAGGSLDVAAGSVPVTLAETLTVKGLETWIPENGSTLVLCSNATGPYVTMEDYKKCQARMIEAIPTSWLDSLLTGKGAVVAAPPYSCKDIERLLQAVKSRVIGASNAASETRRT